MPKANVKLFEGRPLLDIASHGRRGPGRRDRLSPVEIAHIARTVRRVPEVVVKVLPRDSNRLSSVGRHIDYIGRRGDLEVEKDDGERLCGPAVGRELIDEWDLDLDEHRHRVEIGVGAGRPSPKLVHKLMLSMPPGTPADGVLAAARNFLREEFAFKHRYAFVLHTDEPHPHVHAVVKAVSEQGVRLNIRKATLRGWRAEFARHLRDQGIEANATERAVRGQSWKPYQDGIYRASLRGASTFYQAKIDSVAAEMREQRTQEHIKSQSLRETRRCALRGWFGAADTLAEQEQPSLADAIRSFALNMPPTETDRERYAQMLRHRQVVRDTVIRGSTPKYQAPPRR